MIDKNELKKLSELSKLYINDDEKDIYLKEINDMLFFLENLEKCDDIKNENHYSVDLREDNVSQGFDFETISKNTNNIKDNYFYVKMRESI